MQTEENIDAKIEAESSMDFEVQNLYSFVRNLYRCRNCSVEQVGIEIERLPYSMIWHRNRGVPYNI